MKHTVGDKRVLVAICLTSFLTNVTSNSINISLPAIGRELSSPAVLLSYVPTAYFLIAGSLLLPFGRTGDFIGRKRTNVIGLGIFLLGAIIGILGATTASLILARSIQGVGVAMIFGTGLAILTAAYPAESRGRVLGINAAVAGIGISIGPVLGGFITHYLGWRYVFAVSLLIAVVSLFVTITTPIDSPPAPDGPYDFKGATFYISGLLLVLFSISMLKTMPAAKWTLIFGLLILLIFMVFEKKQLTPLLDIDLLAHNRVLTSSILSSFIVFSSFGGLIFVYPLYLQSVKHYSAQSAGLIMLVLALAMAMVSPLAGRLADKFEPRLVAAAGNIIMSLVLAMGLFINQGTSLIVILVCMVLMGIGFGLFSSPNNYCVVSSVSEDHYGVATSALNTMQMVGQAFGMSVVSLIVSILFGTATLNEKSAAVLSCYHMVMLSGALLGILGVILSMVRGHAHELHENT